MVYMGKLEQESKRRAKRNEIRKLTLRVIQTAGVLGVAVIAPNVLTAMHKLGLLPHSRQQETLRRSIDRLYAAGYLEHAKGGLRLSQKGEMYLRRLETRSFSVRKPVRWDGRWRVLIFDIPERRRRLRDGIRHTLRTNGFVRMQNSVWVYPYDCEDWVNLWKAELNLGRELLYLIVDSIEGSSALKRSFDL